MPDPIIVAGFWVSAAYILSKAIEAYEIRRVTPFYAFASALIFLVVGVSSDDIAAGYAGFGMFLFSCILAVLTQMQGVALQMKTGAKS